MPARRATDVHVDLLKKVGPNTSVGVGLGRRGVSFTGSF
jgi:hypothetical protein